MALLALVLALVAIFVGHWKGLGLYIVGTAVLWIFGSHPAVVQSHEAPIFLASFAVTVVAIFVSHWKGVLVWVLGGCAIFVAVLFGLL